MTYTHTQTKSVYTEAYIKEKVYVSLRKKQFRAKQAKKKSRRREEDEGDVGSPAPLKKKPKVMTPSQRKEEIKRLSELAKEALAKKERTAEWEVMYADKKEEVEARLGDGMTPARVPL